ISQIQEKLSIARGKQLLDLIADDKRALTHRDSAAEIKNDDDIQTPGIDNHAHCGALRIFFTMRSRQPPPSRCERHTSSMKDRLIRMPRPLGFRRFAVSVGRSEERRVGKECRWRRWGEAR